jgi:Predicted glycosyltransferases
MSVLKKAKMTNSSLAPITLFVYNRPEHTLRTLEALANNILANESILYIYADGPKEDIEDVASTRKIIRQKQWCKEVHIIESKVNNGLADSIIRGVSEVINKYGKVIVLEDDIVTSPYFLQYMNDALSLYENEDKVMHISSFVPKTTGAEKLQETYFLRFMSCWGWATWKRAWDKLITDISYLHKSLPKRADFKEYNLEGALNQYALVELNYRGELKTWAIKWYSTIFIDNGLCLYPRQSLVENIGFDGSGENTICTDGSFNVQLTTNVNVRLIDIKPSKYAKSYLKRFYIFGPDSNYKKRIKRILKSTSLHKLYAKIRYRKQ